MSNRPVIEYASTILQSAGWTTREVVYRDAAGIEKVNLIAAPAGQDVDAREVELAFVCHTDTVPYSVGWGDQLRHMSKTAWCMDAGPAM